MTHNFSPRNAFVLTLVIPLVLTMTLSGCTLLGLGAAAGATAGGCALLDTNEDDVVSEMELSAGLFDEWDSDGDGELTEKEFDVGAEASGAFTESSVSFVAWDENEDGVLSEEEFADGISEQSDTEDWADRQCDELGL